MQYNTFKAIRSLKDEVNALHHLDMRGRDIEDLFNHLKAVEVADKALRTMGYTKEWHDLFNVDNQLLEMAGVTETDLYHRTDWGKVDVCHESFGTWMVDMIIKGYQWIISQCKAVAAFLAKWGLGWDHRFTFSSDKVFDTLSTILAQGVAKGKGSTVGLIPRGTYIVKECVPAITLRNRYDVIAALADVSKAISLSFGAHKQFDIFDSSIPDAYQSAITRFGNVDPGVRMTSKDIEVRPLTLKDIDIGVSSNGYDDGNTIEWFDFAIRNYTATIQATMATLKNIEKASTADLNDIRAKHGVDSFSFDDANRRLATIGRVFGVTNKYINEMRVLRGIITRVIEQYNKAWQELGTVSDK